jgi:hypothetical protein
MLTSLIRSGTGARGLDHKGDHILLLLRRELCAEDQVEELDRVFEGRKTLVMQRGWVVLLRATQRF